MKGYRLSQTPAPSTATCSVINQRQKDKNKIDRRNTEHIVPEGQYSRETVMSVPDQRIYAQLSIFVTI